MEFKIIKQKSDEKFVETWSFDLNSTRCQTYDVYIVNILNLDTGCQNI